MLFIHLFIYLFVSLFVYLFISYIQEQQDNYDLLLKTFDIILDKLRHGK